MKKGFFLVYALALALAAGGLFIYAQTVEEHLRKGDEYYAAFDDAKALEEYLQAIKLDPANYEALWKASRALVDVGDAVNPVDKDAKTKQIKMYKDAAAYARQAVRANPNDTWGHFFLSAAMGKRALLLGKKEQVQMSKEIKAAIEKAIELDGTNDLAYHALGRWHRRMAEIGGMKRFFGGLLYGSIPKGTFEESEKYLKKAVELRPDYTNHHLELGRTYVAMERYDLAAAEFQKCIDSPVTTSKCELYKKEAAAELDQLKAKKKAS